MTKQSLQVLGICRWSYPSDNRGFRKTSKDLDAVRARLYTEERLNHRLFLLEHVVLPALEAQTDRDFRVVMVLGDTLPEPFRARLLSLIARVPQIEPVFSAEGERQAWVARREMIRLRDPDAEAVAEFRLDDDDAVSVDFVETTRQIFGDIRNIYDKAGLFGLDYSRGYLMRTDGAECNISPVKTRFWSPGQAVYMRPGEKRSVLDFHHLQFWHEMPTMIWVDKPMFVRGSHHDNDSNVPDYGPRMRKFEMREGQLKRSLQKRFGIDRDALCAAWAERHDGFCLEAA